MSTKSETSSRKDRRKMGKALRRDVPFGSHADWRPAEDRPDPVSLLQAQDEGRVKRLLPIKYGRMLESPFTFFRGSAVLMAADLAGTPTTGIDVALCGDAHLSNFGVFASPERRLIFDVNDFDEVYPGPWEWDLKRLATSGVIAGRDNGFSEKKCRKLAAVVARAYGEAMDYFSNMDTLEQWYFYVNADQVLEVFEQSSKRGEKSAQKMVKKARSRTHEQTLEKLTTMEAGQRRIISDPPLLVPVREKGLDEYVEEAEFKKISAKDIEYSWSGYLDSLPNERRYLLQRYEIVDIAFRVGGIGSVGTRCLIVLLKGGAKDDYLLLQLKEAGASALEAYLAAQNYESQAERVVSGQRVMQATSDIFLGWHRGQVTAREFYWRQLKDMKGSADVASMDVDGLEAYLAVCAWCLARAHARTGDEIMIRGYLGSKGGFEKALADFAVTYADQAERDYQALVDAVESGRVAAETGI
jgi:uncharacterized protein (DUF2252 family)